MALLAELPPIVQSALVADHPSSLCLHISVDELNALYRWEDTSGQYKARTLLHLAAYHSAADCLEALLIAGGNPNLSSPNDGQTPLHCACLASASQKGARVIALLLKHGALKDLTDHDGRLPCDFLGLSVPQARFNVPTTQSGKPELSKECYQTDEFRMFSFKIEGCPKLGEMHDWTDCPYLHPGEKARRRDPRVFPYQAIPCPEFRKGNCKRGDGCPFSHGVFECWLHPCRYRTQLCKEGTACTRSICFFAHTVAQLREPTPTQPAATQLTPLTIAQAPHKEEGQCLSSKAHPVCDISSSSRPGSPGSTLHGGMNVSSCGTSRCTSPGATAAAAEAALRQAFGIKPQEGDSSLIPSPTVSDCSTVDSIFSAGALSAHGPLAGYATPGCSGEDQVTAIAVAATIRGMQQQQQAAAAAAATINRLFKVPSSDEAAWMPPPASTTAVRPVGRAPSLGMLSTLGDTMQESSAPCAPPSAHSLATLSASLSASMGGVAGGRGGIVDVNMQAAAVQRMLAGLGI